MINKIQNINASLWISASAGSGKTKSLIDRIIALLLNNQSPKKILCLTYTNAGASEMKNRLSKQLKKFNEINSAELLSELEKNGYDQSYSKKAKALFDESLKENWVSIQTIHGYCLDLLKKFPIETGLFPGVTLCTDYQKNQLLKQAIHDTITQAKYSNLCKQIAKYTQDISTIIQESSLIDISDFVDTFNNFEQLYSDFFNTDNEIVKLDQNQLIPKLFEKIFNNNHSVIFKNLADKLIKGSIADQKKAEILYQNAISPTENFINAFLTKEHIVFTTLCTKKIQTNVFLNELQLVANQALLFVDLKLRYELIKTNTAFFEIIKIIIKKFRKLKQENHCLDYDDAIVMTNDLLKNIDWVLYKLDSSIDHLLIDESQDTSPEQWDIIKKLTENFFLNDKNQTIYVVGDEKQSIFSFQGANINLFHKMHTFFKEKSLCNKKEFFDITLNTSYRTSANILNFVDDILANSFKDLKHIANRNQNGSVIEIISPFVNLEIENNNEFDDSGKILKKEVAQYIAEIIQNTINNNVLIESKNRAAQACDFFILFQKRDIFFMKEIIKALKEKNIKSTGLDQIILKEEIIVQDLLVIAEFSVFPIDDLICARCLKTPIIGMSDSDLQIACLNRKDANLWEYITNNPELSQKYQINILQKCIENSKTLSVYNFFQTLLNNNGKEKFIEKLGIKHLDVLNEFLNIVLDFENTNTPSLQNFIFWFKSFEHKIKKESFQQDNAVRLLTVHGSKGLESPVIILADTHITKNKTQQSKILKSQDNILFWRFNSSEKNEKIKKLSTTEMEDNLNESKRLLYVAMTRAEDLLYIISIKNNENLPESCWYKIIENNFKKEKFIEKIRNNKQILQFGTYSYNAPATIIESKKEIQRLPDWFFLKNKEENNVFIEQSISEKNEQTIYGDCVHLLLHEMTKYTNNFKEMADHFIENVQLSDQKKYNAQNEAKNVMIKFPQIFDENSLSEFTYIHNSKERRIDKIIFENDAIMIIDFKTGIPQKIIPQQYIEQLRNYKIDVSNMFHKNFEKIKTAILWTQSAELVNIQI